MRIVILIAIGLLPGLVTLFLIKTVIGRPLVAYVPNSWNDLVGYWHYIKSFSAVGFASGYYNYNETPAPLGAIHYDVHGPVFPVLYGSVASIFGWQPYSAFFYNASVIAVAVSVFAYMTALTHRQLALLASLLSVYWIVPLYLPSPNQEPVHAAAALVFAGVFGRLLFFSRTMSRTGRAAFWIFLLVMSLMRLSWCLLSVPYLVLSSRHGARRALWQGALLGGVYTVGIMLLFKLIAAPGGNSIIEFIAALSDPSGAILKALAVKFVSDILPTFGVGRSGGMRYGDWQSFLAVGLLFALLVVALRARRFTDGEYVLAEKARETMVEATFHWYQLGGMFLASWLLYIPAGYERVLGTHLLLSAALMVVARRNWIVIGLIVAMAAAAPYAVRDFGDNHREDFSFDTEKLRLAGKTLAQLVPYQSDPPSPWCNTLVLLLSHYDWHVIALPPGIGVSWTSSFDTLPHALRSRYVLATEKELQPLRRTQPDTHLVRLGQLSDGLGIYLNDRCVCQR